MLQNTFSFFKLRNAFFLLLFGLTSLFILLSKIEVLDFNSYVADTRKNFSLHIMPDGDMDGVVLLELIDVDREVVLIIADSLTSCYPIVVNEVALDCIHFLYLVFLALVRIDALFYDERQTHERISTCDSQPQLFLVCASSGKGRNVKRQRIIFLPSSNRRMDVLVIHQVVLAG